MFWVTIIYTMHNVNATIKSALKVRSLGVILKEFEGLRYIFLM